MLIMPNYSKCYADDKEHFNPFPFPMRPRLDSHRSPIYSGAALVPCVSFQNAETPLLAMPMISTCNGTNSNK